MAAEDKSRCPQKRKPLFRVKLYPSRLPRAYLVKGMVVLCTGTRQRRTHTHREKHTRPEQWMAVPVPRRI